MDATLPPRTRALTPVELSRRWRCRIVFVRALVRDGKLPAIKFGRGLRILPEAVVSAESGVLAVRPAVRRRRDEISPAVRSALEE